jgi:putative SOS response-associated peptidase YedK
VLADGWLEWQKAEDRKQPRQPFLHELEGGVPMAFAGCGASRGPRTPTPRRLVHDRHRGANREASRLHDRMPAVLRDRGGRGGLADPRRRPRRGTRLVAPLPDGLVRVSAISQAGNAVAADDPQLAMPV